jgi:hypothetical protein
MRIIRTEMYFDEDQVSGYEMFRSRHPRRGEAGKNPGLAFLWIKHEEDDVMELYSSPEFMAISRGSESFVETDDIRGVIDLFIRDADETSFLRITPDGRIRNRDTVDFVLDQQIVMEHSPPFSISFKTVLDQKNSPMWIGTFIGADMAWDHPVLLLITVPSGIIIVSSALGIGAAMQAGLNKTIKRFFEGRKT